MDGISQVKRVPIDGISLTQHMATVTADRLDELKKKEQLYNKVRQAALSLPRYKIGYRDSLESREGYPSMLPHEQGAYVSFVELSELFISDEERAKRDHVKNLDDEIARLTELRNSITNGN